MYSETPETGSVCRIHITAVNIGGLAGAELVRI